MVRPCRRLGGLIGFILTLRYASAQCFEEICTEDYNSLLQRKKQRRSSMSLDDAIQKARELASKMSFDEKSQIVKGTAYDTNVWNPPPGFFVGNTVTAYPSTLAVAATWDRELGFTWGEALGKEFFAKGGNVLLGPGLNVHRVARNGRNVEYLSGEAGFLGAELVHGYIKGVHSQNVVTVMKHFIGNNQETLRSFVDSIISQRALWEVYYQPFQAALEAGCLSTMCAYNLVNGIHACQNGDIMQTDLKDTMGYKGFIMSDWWALHAFSALKGLDQEMPGNKIDGNPMNQVYDTTKDLSTLPEDFLESMVARILLPVVKYGLIENPVCNPVNGGCDHQIYEVNARSPEHQQLARRMVAESVILLENEDETLPLGKDLTIAVLGSACQSKQDITQMLDKWDLGNYYTVGGSGRVIPKDPVSILEGIQDACKFANCKVHSDLSDDAEVASKVAQEAKADVTVICGATTSTEGMDRASLSIDQESFVVEVAKKLDALDAMPTVVVTLIPGSIVMPWTSYVDAELAVFLAGEATGLGIADVLFGYVNPGAKSPVTFPLHESDTIPPCEPPKGKPMVEPTDSFPCDYTEGVMAGFTFYEDIEVQYPFGHGLSYTTFGVELEPISGTDCDARACITVQVTNTGPVPGSEVVQLYLVFPPGLGEPKRGVLRGFQKVSLLPDFSKKVVMKLLEKDVSIYDETQKKWTVPKGRFTVMIGSSSRDILAEGHFDIE